MKQENPAKEEKKQIGPKVNAHLVRKAKAYCYLNGIDFQSFVEKAIQAYLDKQEA